MDNLEINELNRAAAYLLAGLLAVVAVVGLAGFVARWLGGG